MSGLTPRGGRAVFRFRDFRLYVTGRFLWGLALQIQNVGIAWFVYELTRDPFALGLIGLATFLPTVPLSLVTGAVADRYDRRRILVVTYALIMVGAVLLCLTVQSGLVWPIYFIVVGVGAFRAFSNPAGQALMAATVPDEEFASAAAWSNTTNQTATVVGPALGGLLYPLGPMVPFVVALVCFVLATCMAYLIAPRPAKGRSKGPVTWSMLVAGYKFIWTCPVVMGAITLDLIAVLLGGATALLPIFASEVFHTGSWGLGLLRSMPAVGSILTALILAHYPLQRRVGRTMFICVFIYGFATIGFGLSTSIWPAMLCLAILGSADVISIVIRSSLIQIETPDAMRGRVIAVHTILTGTSNNLGDFESGVVASAIGAVPAVVVGGVGAILGAALWIRLFPSLWTRDRLSPGGLTNASLSIWLEHGENPLTPFRTPIMEAEKSADTPAVAVEKPVDAPALKLEETAKTKAEAAEPVVPPVKPAETASAPANPATAPKVTAEPPAARPAARILASVQPAVPLGVRALDMAEAYGYRAAGLLVVLGLGWIIGANSFDNHANERRVAEALRALDTKIEMVSTKIVTGSEVAALKRNLDDMKLGLDGARKTTVAISELRTKIDAAERSRMASVDSVVDRVSDRMGTMGKEQGQRLDKLAARLDDIEKQLASQIPTASIPPASAAGRTPEPIQIPGVNAPSTLPRSDNHTTIERMKVPENGYVLREVYNGIALVEGRRGLMEVAPGDALPGAGRVRSIERRNRQWVVVTTNGVIDTNGY